MTVAGSERLEKLLVGLLGALLLLAALSVSWQMLRPERRTANLDAVMQDCLGIISAARDWHHRSERLGGAERRGFGGLRFDRIGYGENLSDGGMTWSNDNARFTLQVAKDGRSFDLVAEAPGGVKVIYRGVGTGAVPNPVIR